MVVLYSFYFMSARQAVLQLVLVGAAYAWLLLDAVPIGQATARWTVMLLTLSIAGLLVGLLNRRVERLLSELLEIARAERTAEPLTLVVADLDDLKGSTTSTAIGPATRPWRWLPRS